MQYAIQVVTSASRAYRDVTHDLLRITDAQHSIQLKYTSKSFLPFDKVISIWNVNYRPIRDIWHREFFRNSSVQAPSPPDDILAIQCQVEENKFLRNFLWFVRQTCFLIVQKHSEWFLKLNLQMKHESDVQALQKILPGVCFKGISTKCLLSSNRWAFCTASSSGPWQNTRLKKASMDANIKVSRITELPTNCLLTGKSQILWR